MRRTILISGSSRGIGRAIAEELLRSGHRISLGVRNTEIFKDTFLDPKVSGNENILLNNYDANNELDAENWVQRTVDNFKSIDTVINCAGIFHKTGLIFKKEERETIEELWSTNVMGPWLLTKNAWEHLSKHGQGRIIVLVSMSGKRSKGNLAGYSMSKFALMGLCQTMRNEGWDQGIRTTAISPGWVNTDMAANVTTIEKDEMTQPNDIAKIVSNLLSLPNSSIPFEINLNCNLEK